MKLSSFLIISLVVKTSHSSSILSSSQPEVDESNGGHHVREAKSIYISTKKSLGGGDSLSPSADHTVNTHGSLLDTFSLSFAGSFDFARTFEGVHKIFQGISSFIDLRVIRAGIDMIFGTLFPTAPVVQPLAPISQRSDHFSRLELDLMEAEAAEADEAKVVQQERLKSGLTTMVGAVMSKQRCWEKTACTVGSYMSNVKAKDVIFILAEKITPAAWAPTLDIVKQSAYSRATTPDVPAAGCKPFECDPRKDGREFGQYYKTNKF